MNNYKVLSYRIVICDQLFRFWLGVLIHSDSFDNISFHDIVVIVHCFVLLCILLPGPPAWASYLGLLPGPPAWASCLGLLPGPPTWASCLGVLPGPPAWASCLGVLPGPSVRASCLGLLHGPPAWASCLGLLPRPAERGHAYLASIHCYNCTHCSSLHKQREDVKFQGRFRVDGARSCFQGCTL